MAVILPLIPVTVFYEIGGGIRQASRYFKFKFNRHTRHAQNLLVILVLQVQPTHATRTKPNSNPSPTSTIVSHLCSVLVLL